MAHLKLFIITTLWHSRGNERETRSGDWRPSVADGEVRDLRRTKCAFGTLEIIHNHHVVAFQGQRAGDAERRLETFGCADGEV